MSSSWNVIKKNLKFCSGPLSRKPKLSYRIFHRNQRGVVALTGNYDITSLDIVRFATFVLAFCDQRGDANLASRLSSQNARTKR